MLFDNVVHNQPTRRGFCGAKDKRGRFRGGMAWGFALPGGRAWVDEKEWLHRKNGPAMEWDSGLKEWYCHGIETRREYGR